MRLSRYINEELKLDDVYKYAKILKSECSQILKIYQKRWKSHENYPFLWRGVSQEKKPIIKKASHLENRQPMSTGVEMHKWLNNWFTDKFGWPVRNGVATTGSHGQTATYGYRYAFFPKNGFKFCWSPDVNDLWGSIESKMPSLNKKGAPIPVRIKYGPDKDHFEHEIIPMLLSYTDKDLEKAIDSGHEVLINCKYYYLVNAEGQFGFGGKEIMSTLGIWQD